MLLNKCDGPPCPRCGCQDTEVRVPPPTARPSDAMLEKYPGLTSWFSGGRGRCRHCGLQFSFRQLPVVEPAEEAVPDEPLNLEPQSVYDEPPLPEQIVVPPAEPAPAPQENPKSLPGKNCPKCGSTKVRVTTTRRPIRHHKCQSCGEKFKSVERDAVTDLPSIGAAPG